MCCTTTAFAVMVGIVRHLSFDLDVFVITFWRNVLALLFFMPWLWRMGVAGLKTRRLGLHAVRAAVLSVSAIALFLAVTLMPIAEMTALTFTVPLFVTLLAIVVLKETVDGPRWVAIAIGFGGVLVILRPGVGIFEWASFMVLLSSATFATQFVLGRKLASTEHPEAAVIYIWLLSSPILLCFAAVTWQWPTAGQWLWLIALAAAASLNMYGIARALNIGEASLAIPFDFLRLPFTTFLAFFAFSEPLDAWTWLGAAIVFGSTLYITRREAASAEA